MKKNEEMLEWRIRMGHSQESLSLVMGLSKTAVGYHETGRWPPSHKNKQKYFELSEGDITHSSWY